MMCDGGEVAAKRRAVERALNRDMVKIVGLWFGDVVRLMVLFDLVEKPEELVV